MKVLLIRHSEVTPVDNPNARMLRTGQICEYLDEKGIHVTWLTATFNHFSKSQRELRSYEHNVFKQSKVRFIKTSGYLSNVSIKRVIDHIRFGFGVLNYLKKNNDYDVIISSYPTITSTFVSVLWGKKNNIPVVVDLRDKWPNVFWQQLTGWKKIAVKASLFPVSWMSSYIFTNSSLTLAPTKSYLLFSRQYARNSRVQDLVSPLGYKKEVYLSKNSDFLINVVNLARGRKIISFVGTVGRMFDFESIVEAAIEEKKHNDRYCFMLFGGGDNLESFRQLTKDMDNIFFMGWINKDEIDLLLKNSFVGLAPYKNISNFVGHLPNKFMEYMSYGLPVLTCLNGEAKDIVIGLGGKYYMQGSSESLCSQLDDFYNMSDLELHDVSKNSQELFETNYSSEAVYSKILGLIERLSSNERSGR